MTLQSADPHVLALTDPRWLCDPGDVKVALAAFKREREIWDTPTFSNLSIGPEYWPGVGNSTDEQILETIHKSVRTIYHAAGTCQSTYADEQKKHLAIFVLTAWILRETMSDAENCLRQNTRIPPDPS